MFADDTVWEGNEIFRGLFVRINKVSRPVSTRAILVMQDLSNACALCAAPVVIGSYVGIFFKL